VSGGSTTGVVQSASVNLGYAVDAANLATSAVGSIKFVGAEPTNIALKGTGGIGRQEFSTLTFQVFDQTAHPVQRAQVRFTLNTTAGGLSLSPSSGLTDANGKVSTVVSAGTMPTPIVLVTATVPDAGITTVSNVLVVSTGLGVKSRSSISTAIGNFEGWEFDSVCTTVTMCINDYFGNPVYDGTAVGFTPAYGSIGASCLTGGVANASNASVTSPTNQTTNSAVSGVSGCCSVDYCSDGVRPPGGRSVVLGHFRGEEDFFDANGNNVCDNCGNTAGQEFGPRLDLSQDIFRDDNENGAWTPGEPCIGPNRNGLCSTPSDGVYNGVLANPKIADAQQATSLGYAYVAIWSGSHAYIDVTQAGSCSAVPPTVNETVTLHFRIVDLNGNPMPAGTKVEFVGPFSVAPRPYAVPNYVLAVGQRFGRAPGQIPIEEYDLPIDCSAVSSDPFVTVTVTTPRGVVTTKTVPVN
jgi:hypothetical protein